MSWENSYRLFLRNLQHRRKLLIPHYFLLLLLNVLEQQTQQLRELLSAIEELHLCLEPLEAPCSDLVARLP